MTDRAFDLSCKTGKTYEDPEVFLNFSEDIIHAYKKQGVDWKCADTAMAFLRDYLETMEHIHRSCYSLPQSQRKRIIENFVEEIEKDPAKYFEKKELQEKEDRRDTEILASLLGGGF